MLNNKRTVALIGGSFNPPHKGHIQLGQSIFDLNMADTVAFMPCNDHAFGKKLIDGGRRIDMLRMALKGDHMCTFSFEIENRTDGKTFNTVKKLFSSSYGGMYDFKYVIGLDCALEIEKWYKWNELINTVPFIVFPRNGYVAPKNAWFNKSPHLFLKDLHIQNTSSSEIRKLIQQFYCGNIDRERILEHVDERVFKYIITKNLYRRL